MRRILLGVALGALLTILVAAPAGAVPAERDPHRQEPAAARHRAELRDAGAWPAPPRTRWPRRGPNTRSSRPPARRRRARRWAATSPRAWSRARRAGTYSSNTLVLLVQFGTVAWPDGDSTGPLYGRPAARPHHAAGARRQRHLLAGRLQPHALPADALRQLVPDLRRRASATRASRRQRRPARNGLPFTTYLRGTSDDTMRNYYLEQSHGAYTVQGDIKDWVTLDLPESYYGADSDPWNSTDDLTGPVWRVARDAIVKFAADNPGFDWAQYDQENPYGITGPDFDQPDGYLDHLDPRPRRQRPVRRRRRPGVRRHLGALVGHLPELQRRPRRRPRHDDPGHRRPGPAGPRHLGLQLHDQPRGRRHRRVLPRVRPRPRPAGRVRLLQHHRRRHQRLLDHHGQRLLARPRSGASAPSRRR